ncbi:dihydroneopterin aldolase [Derxia lacustris]|uniref:dihydroneopterin aldolase n=1 Tax=Derxia lacustris TaxID=764842 RepID=UPI000A175EC8|nr:dihydroneopterin aldolase [Derxia lacustris]
MPNLASLRADASVNPALPGASANGPLDIVYIEGFTGETVIGIHDDELHRTQPVRIDIAAGVARALACDTDRIGDTIDYSVVRSVLLDLLREHRFQLLEALAERVAQILLVDFGARWVRVGVAKPRKFDDVEAVGVIIERSQPAERAPVAAARGDGSVLSLIGAGLIPGRTR